MKVEKIINEIKQLDMRESILFYRELHKLNESKKIEHKKLQNELNQKLKEIGIDILDERN